MLFAIATIAQRNQLSKQLVLLFCSYDMLWADPVQGWVDHQFGEFIPNGELIAAGSHPAIFDRSQVTSSRETVYVNFCPRVCATSVMFGAAGGNANREFSVSPIRH